jgi:hypothetical protein
MYKRVSEQDLYLRKVQTIGKYHQAFLTIASPLVSKLKLSKGETLIERLEGDSIVISKASINPVSHQDDGDGWV